MGSTRSATLDEVSRIRPPRRHRNGRRVTPTRRHEDDRREESHRHRRWADDGNPHPNVGQDDVLPAQASVTASKRSM
jgi:hypothetical protein